tara:strand:- start:25073 stop:25186 length:114 start_codon:yes stop_codon:yes gene_type:complete
MKEYLPIVFSIIVIGILAYRYRNKSGDDSDFDDFDFD